VSPPFRAAEHIRRREEFERIYEAGARQTGRNMIIFVQPTAHAWARLGIAATRKLGSAVVRNRAKRLVRELFRQNKPAGGLDVVVVPRREMLDASYSSLEAEFRALLGRPVRQTRPASVGRRSKRTGADSRL
jgi:ribonuclease P protein component